MGQGIARLLALRLELCLCLRLELWRLYVVRARVHGIQHSRKLRVLNSGILGTSKSTGKKDLSQTV